MLGLRQVSFTTVNVKYRCIFNSTNTNIYYFKIDIFLSTFCIWYSVYTLPSPLSIAIPCTHPVWPSYLYMANSWWIMWFTPHFNVFKIPNGTLTHWGLVTHICVSKLAIIDCDNGVTPGRLQAITLTNAGILLFLTWGTNLSEIVRAVHAF